MITEGVSTRIPSELSKHLLCEKRKSLKLLHFNVRSARSKHGRLTIAFLIFWIYIYSMTFTETQYK